MLFWLVTWLSGSRMVHQIEPEAMRQTSRLDVHSAGHLHGFDLYHNSCWTSNHGCSLRVCCSCDSETLHHWFHHHASFQNSGRHGWDREICDLISPSIRWLQWCWYHRETSIKQSDHEVKCFLQQFQPEAYFNKPIDQYVPHPKYWCLTKLTYNFAWMNYVPATR